MQAQLTNEYLDSLCHASADPRLFDLDEKYQAEKESFPKQVIDINDAVRVFYALIHLEAKENKNGTRLTSFQTFYNARLAQAIFDYCVGSVSGELRHALDILTSNYKIAFHPSLLGYEGNHVHRKAAIKAALQLDPASLLNVALQVFDLPGWGDSFGGANWANIAGTTLRKGSISNLRWIDEIVHCRHCGGKLFDRSMIFLPEDIDFRNFLDYRQSGQYETDLEAQGYTYDTLLRDFGETIEAVLNYKPVNFGFTTFRADVSERHQFNQDGPNEKLTIQHKTQKQINAKPYNQVKTCFNALPSIKIYISSKYNASQQAEFIKVFCFGQTYTDLPFSSKIIRVYFLYPYISKGKTYLRKAEILVNKYNAGKKIHEKLLNQVLQNTSDSSKIKVYIDRIG